MVPARFTIITVSRNAAAHIGSCLESVLRQTYAEVEHVVIDGASTDGTQNIVESLSGRVSVFVSEPDRGIYDAMNKGLSRARGDYILFLGADDYLIDENVLADVAQRLQEAPADVVYGGLEVRRGDGHISVFHPPPPAEALDFMICGCLPHQATFAHKSVFERIGPFDQRAGDLLVRPKLGGQPLGLLPQALHVRGVRGARSPRSSRVHKRRMSCAFVSANRPLLAPAISTSACQRR